MASPGGDPLLSKKAKAPARATSRPKAPPRRYSITEIQVALAVVEHCLHPDGKPNWSKAARESGVAIMTLKKWHADPVAYGVASEVVATIKKELEEDFLDKLKRTRSRLIDRIYKVAETEKDIYKLSGAFKTVMDAVGEEEVNSALASRIRGPTQTETAAGTEAARNAGSPAAATA